MANQKGINISNLYIDKITDWELLSKSIDFIILRGGEGSLVSKDDSFEDFYAAAQRAKIPLGAYWDCKATTVSEAEAEGTRCIESIKGKGFDFPIFYNIINEATLSRTADEVSAIADAFLKKLKSAKYKCGISSSSWMLSNKISEEIRKKYWIWIIKWTSDMYKPENITEQQMNISYTGDYAILQQDKATIAGISEQVYINISYKQYDLLDNPDSAIIEEEASTNVTRYLTSKGESINNTTIKQWIDDFIIYDEELIRFTNEDLDKIVIGKGAVNLQGNYSLQGAQDAFGNISESDTEYITFKDLFTPLNTRAKTIKYTPSKEIGTLVDKEGNKGAALTKEYHYHQKNGKKWSWSDEENTNIVSVKDQTFLLFKANQTIENPYIGIKVQSEPLLIIFDSIIKTTYGFPTKQGIEIEVKEQASDNSLYYYYDNIPIKIIPVNKSTCSKNFLDLISFDSETGDFNQNCSVIWQDSYLVSNYNSWSGTVSAFTPAICATFAKTTSGNASRPYLLFLNDKYQGIIYLTYSEEQGG